MSSRCAPRRWPDTTTPRYTCRHGCAATACAGGSRCHPEPVPAHVPPMRPVKTGDRMMLNPAGRDAPEVSHAGTHARRVTTNALLLRAAARQEREGLSASRAPGCRRADGPFYRHRHQPSRLHNWDLEAMGACAARAAESGHCANLPPSDFLWTMQKLMPPRRSNNR